MPGDRFLGSAILLLLAFLWGLGFVFQRSGMDHLGPHSFNAARFGIAAISLIPVLYFFGKPTPRAERTRMIWASLAGGSLFFGGISFQQVGLVHTTAGKAAFITGLYIVLVPVLSIALGHVARWNIWLACLLAISGLFLMVDTGSFQLAYGDGLVLICSLFWATQILVTGAFAGRLDGVTFAFGQVVTVALIALPTALWLETPTWPSLWAARFDVLFVGVIVTAAGMVLQILGQRRVPPTPAGIIMSLEAVFGALCGYLFLSEAISFAMFSGGVLMLAGMVLAQLTLPPLFGRAHPKGSL